MREFQADGRTISTYLAEPEQGSGPGVLVLHAWWGLTDVFKQVCDRLAQEGFIALAPDLYHGKTTTSIDEAKQLASEMREGETSQDLIASIGYLLQQPGRHGKALGAVGFSLGGAYALDMSVTLAEEIAAAVTFYAAYPGLDYRKASAAYLCHFAEDDPFESAESVAEMEQELQAAGKSVTFYTYPRTKHWFFEDNRPEYDAEAARVAWERTIAFLHQHLD